ncbi:MAG: polysaccharide deacetylase family protein [Candidatus Latescibacteria bacterium]|nr:polysaccharide deacetylase family protein [bacterium]MBD3424350.1 polysaccharide deacetylase family protein [Candidatus Latescibacterota bacterium]
MISFSTIIRSAGALLIIAITASVLLSFATEEEIPCSPPEGTERGVPVLAYHYFNDRNIAERALRAVGTVLLNLPLLDTRDAWAISASSFEKHLRYLQENGFRAITMAELERYLLEGVKPAEKCVAITFDDGDRSVYRYAYPLLKKYHMQGALFLITSKPGTEWNELEISNWKELEEMEDSGVIEIHSHTHDMHYKVTKGKSPHPVFQIDRSETDREKIAGIAGDLRRSRIAIRHHLGKTTRFLAWPYGFSTPLGDSLAAESGFDMIVTLKRGPNLPGDPLKRVRRFTITPRTSMRNFREMVEGSVQK